MCEHKPSSGVIDSRPERYPGQLLPNERLYGAAQGAIGSRRRRLWELSSHTHCPLIGVCLPMPVLRRLIGKALGQSLVADDYAFHVAAVAECSRRKPVSEALQRELDRRYAPTLRRFAQAKTQNELAALWNDALKGTSVAGALWATLSHGRCDELLRERVCSDIHMLQHQVGAANRADLQRLDQLQDGHATLAREMAALRERHARIFASHAADVERINAELMQGRARLIARDTALAAARDDLAGLRTVLPDLQERLDLVRRVELQRHRIHELEGNRTALQQRAEREAARADTLERQLAALREHVGAAPVSACGGAVGPEQPALNELRDKAVLCVGGRTASVPTYRQLIEYTGGRFSHHDGGEEDSASQLEASLAAADLVICQTGCISHGAYWRVKDHCKRTGKRCLFVDRPSASSLARCLRNIAETEGES